MKEKKELNVPVIMLFIFGLVVFMLVASFIYLSMNGLDYTEEYLEETEEIKNKSELEIIDGVNLSGSQEEIVREMAIILKLYNLHEIPYTSTTPKIQTTIDENYYWIEIKKGDILIKKEAFTEVDITIKTSSEEITKMKKDEDYVTKSITLRRTKIEKVASDFVLFSKGYFDLYRKVDFGM